jgi:hypothetical protein
MVLTMRLKIDYPARLATVTLDGESQVDLAGLDVFIQKAMNEPVGLMALELIVPAGDHHGEELRKRGFRVTGNVCENAETRMVMHKRLSPPSFSDTPRSVYLNPELSSATPAPVLQPTKEEQAAHANLSASLDHFYSESASNARLAALEAESAKFKKGRDEASDIASNANKLARAIMRTPEPTE